MEEKTKKQLFLDEIKLTIEQEYNAPEKPKLVEQIDRKLAKQKLESLLKEFCKKNNESFEEIIQYSLTRINERRKIVPEVKEEYNVIEEIMLEILNEGKESQK